MKEISCRSEVVKKFALFLEGDTISRQVPELKILRRTNVLLQTAIDVRSRATDVRNAESAQIVDVAKRIGPGATFDNFVIDSVRRQEKWPLKPGICW